MRKARPTRVVRCLSSRMLAARLQEKEFEVTNEYIFALGSHVLYWASKDVSLFIAQRILAESTPQESGSASRA